MQLLLVSELERKSPNDPNIHRKPNPPNPPPKLSHPQNHRPFLQMKTINFKALSAELNAICQNFDRDTLQHKAARKLANIMGIFIK